ncbi:MAG: 2C-methyl-D-erythritol 2,4-cyclodiphosphate synthase [Candidatus Xenolissoclinum pacificiensis L6]|uniref:2-C-methyl-D-erythritol 2,4-cyclodiphosphate synthase n=1 Tax=Candidatus Xenolissoclinum pacificiensis L6 TaxID=1401685 RepID=W2UZ08_9RICK|nr:MAG: 2C-methyl-D-erythritol 2,4-cyclodiphosphate synthase [Candidatus Xenolissoclinum pacificiensis L6]
MNIRIGHGFDVHAYDKNKDDCMLCGVRILSGVGIKAHSDGDLVLHALTDAILGALAKGDIGDYFPDTDDEGRGRDSMHFVQYAMNMLENMRYMVSNIDITIVSQDIYVSPYKAQMVKILEDNLNLKKEAINIKATTTDKLGFIGRNEGISCMVTVLLISESSENIT